MKFDLLVEGILNEILEEKKIDKWDGKLPQFVGNDKSIMMFNPSSHKNKEDK